LRDTAITESPAQQTIDGAEDSDLCFRGLMS